MQQDLYHDEIASQHTQSRSKRRRLNSPEFEEAIGTNAVSTILHSSINGAVSTPNSSGVPQEYEGISQPLSPRTLYNRAPRYPRTQIDDGNWQITDPHHDYCTECGMGSDLISCKTCPQSWHPWCIVPHFTPCTPPESWFCQVCIERGWNELDYTIAGNSVVNGTSSSPFSQPSIENLPNENKQGAGWAQGFNQKRSDSSNILTSDGSYPGMSRTSTVLTRIDDLNQAKSGGSSHGFVVETIDAAGIFPDAVASLGDQQPSHDPDRGGVMDIDNELLIALAASNSALISGRLRARNSVIPILENDEAKTIKSKKRPPPTIPPDTFLLAQNTFYVDNPTLGLDASHRKDSKRDVSIRHLNDERDSLSKLYQLPPSDSEYRYKPRRSRYTALPPKIDDAVSLIIGELDLTSGLQRTLRDLEAKNTSLEQSRKIQQGKDALAQKMRHDTHIADQAALATELATTLQLLDCARADNQRLRADLVEAARLSKSRDEERTSWMATLSSLLGK